MGCVLKMEVGGPEDLHEDIHAQQELSEDLHEEVHAQQELSEDLHEVVHAPDEQELYVGRKFASLSLFKDAVNVYSKGRNFTVFWRVEMKDKNRSPRARAFCSRTGQPHLNLARKRRRRTHLKMMKRNPLLKRSESVRQPNLERRAQKPPKKAVVSG